METINIILITRNIEKLTFKRELLNIQKGIFKYRFETSNDRIKTFKYRLEHTVYYFPLILSLY